MSRPSKIVQLGLEDHVLKMRDAGKSKPQIVEACNRRLRADHEGKGDPPSVSESAVKRYLEHIAPAELVAAAHQSQIADANASLSLHFGAEFQELFDKVRGWVDEADTGRLMQVVGKGDDAREVDMGPDWHARKVAASELRQLLDLYATIAERVFNAKQIQLFQEIVLTAIEDADEPVAQKIRGKLAQVTEIRRAALLGVAA